MFIWALVEMAKMGGGCAGIWKKSSSVNIQMKNKKIYLGPNNAASFGPFPLFVKKKIHMLGPNEH